MAHWLAWKLGVISKDQAYHLQGLKVLAKNPNVSKTVRDQAYKEYEEMEHKWGANRKSLEKRFGKKFIDEYEMLNKETYHLTFRTNSRTGKKYPVRVPRK